jgi:hypothetical protein
MTTLAVTPVNSLFCQASHVEESMQCGRVTTSYRTWILLTPQKTLHHRLVKAMDFGFGLPPPEPLGKPGDQLRLILNGSGRIPQILDKCRECVLVPSPWAGLPADRSEKLFFHPARMTPRFLADYAESLLSKRAHLAEAEDAFGTVRHSA